MSPTTPITVRKGQVPPVVDAVLQAADLFETLQRPADTRPPCVEARLAALHALIGCLPLDQSEFCFFVNRVNSTAELCRKGERGAARYQLREVGRRLEGLLADLM